MANTYRIGNLVRLTATFTTAQIDPITGMYDPVDPTSVTFTVRKPDRTLATTSSPVRDNVGVYHWDVSATLAGEWRWRVTGIGAAQASDESEYQVAQPGF